VRCCHPRWLMLAENRSLSGIRDLAAATCQLQGR
jgi:hypothetical protein